MTTNKKPVQPDKESPVAGASPTRNHKGPSPYYSTPFSAYMRQLDRIDKGKRNNKEFGSILILTLVEEMGEMARAYLAEHGRKRTNLAAQRDETYQQELGDILVSIFRFARIKKINLHERIAYSLDKIERRQTQPKQ